MRPFCRLFAAILFTLGAGQGAAAETEWPVTRFEVCFENPDSWALSLGFDSCTGDEVLAERIETYMEEVGAELRRQGFPPPTLPDPSETDEGLAYRVYVFDAPDTVSQANHNNPCAGASPYIYLDLTRSDGSALFEDSDITNKGYADIAHEMFHAVQASYKPFVDTCHIGEWIREGSAQAWGKDTALKLKNVPRDEKNRPTEVWDARRYDRELYVRERRSMAYNTGSFWRFLGEDYAARRSGDRATISERTPDYSYLRTLFEQPLPGEPDATSEYGWVDRGLRDAFGRGLGSLYAQFAGHFAAFVPGREMLHTSLRDRVAAQAELTRRRDRWLSFLFDSCPRLDLSADNPVIRTEYRMPPMSSRCVVVAASPLAWLDLSVQVYSEGEVDLDHIAVSVAGDGRMARGSVVDLPGGLSLAGFTIPLDLRRDQVLLLSNAAPAAAETRQIDLPVAFSISTHQASIQDAPDAATAPDAPASGNGTEEAEEAAGDPVKAAAADRLQTGAYALTPNRLSGNSVSRDPAAANCAHPFVFTACGPSTNLQFALRPDGVGDLDTVSGVGGLVSQIVTNVDALGSVAAQDPTYLARLRERMSETDGAEISIRMPLVDYGFTGSFSNARIVVSMADGEGLEAVGPADVEPGPARRFPLSGTVTIEEYTPLLMRGSFSANLVTMGDRGQEDNPVLPVAHQLTGRFIISQPWRNDRRAKPRQVTGSTAEALDEAFPGLDVVPGIGISAGGAPVTGATSTAASSGDAIGCNCSCNFAHSSSPSCHTQCAPVVSACAPEMPRPVATPSPAETAQAAEALRAELIDALQSTGASDVMIAQQLSTFDAMPDAAKPLFVEMIKPK